MAVSPYASPIIGGVVVQPDGKILVAATVDRGFGVIRFNSNGTLDTTFGEGDGLVTTLNASGNFTRSIALQADGKILIAGSGSSGTTSTLIRYNNNGTLDTSFAEDGIITINASFARSGSFDDIAIQPDGKIVVAEDVATLGGAISVLRRYNLDGSLDPSFDGDSIDDSINDLAIQSDGKIIALTDSSIYRFNSNGSLDSSWSGDGDVSLFEVADISFNSYDLDAITLQPDGKILVAGSYKDSETDTTFPLFARFNPDGTLDTSFAEDGTSLPLFVFDSRISQSPSSFNPAIKGLTLQADGKFLVTAELDNGRIALARFNSDGGRDFDFGDFGSITTPLTNNEDENLVLQPNGQILVAGIDSNGFVSVARYIGFEADQYGASHPDLITGIGYDLEALTQHYYNAGVIEGRVTDNFGEFRYIASNPDLMTAYGADSAAATYHYITYGFGEGRSLTAFDAARYILSCEDLEDAFFFDLEAASEHYVTSGLGEGRNPNLFGSDRYIASYTDLIQGYGYNLQGASEHYLFTGRGEGREVLFDPQAYLDRYPDLAGFGNDLTAATYHYITAGFDEGRTWM